MMPQKQQEESTPSSLPWYAIYTKHQHEKTVRGVLGGKGFEVLLPLYQAEHRWRDRRKVVSLPVFPCYLFVRTSLDRRVEVLQTPGVFWLVESAGRPCVVPDGEIEAIRKIMEGPAKFEPHPYLKCGDYVRICQGPLAGIEGILIRKKNACRVVLSVDLLQKSLAVEVEAALVERIGSAAGSRGLAGKIPQEVAVSA